MWVASSHRPRRGVRSFRFRRPGPQGGGASTSQGHPRTIFRRALEHDNLVLAEVTAREIGPETIAEALELTALVARKQPERYGRFAARWLCRYLEEHEKATLEDVALLVSNLRSLATRKDHDCGGSNADPNGVGCPSPSWSPDGEKIVFSRQVGIQPHDIYTVNADGSGLVQVTNTPDITEFSADWGIHPLTP